MQKYSVPVLVNDENVADRGQFISQLAILFDSRQGKDHGSIHLTQKRRMHNMTWTSNSGYC